MSYSTQPPHQPPQQPGAQQPGGQPQSGGHPPRPEPLPGMYGDVPRTHMDSNTKMMAILTHGLTIITAFIAPLIFWIVSKDKQDPDSRYITENSKHAFNFSLTMFLAGIILGIISGVLTLITLGLFAAVAPLLTGAPGILILIFAIIAMVKVNEGETYRYPNGLTIRFIK